jgi:hypothetical protein
MEVRKFSWKLGRERMDESMEGKEISKKGVRKGEIKILKNGRRRKGDRRRKRQLKKDELKTDMFSFFFRGNE